MGCNCGKGRSRQYEYTDSNGKKTTYRNEAEALAAKMRNGGSYIAVTR